MRLTTLGVGAQDSPRYAPAGLLVSHRGARVMIDGGPGAVPAGRVDAWLVTDARAELIAAIRRHAGTRGLVPSVAAYVTRSLTIEPRRVVHTSHPTYGYRIRAAGAVVVWAPEFFRFPRWAAGADVLFAEAAGWNRPIRFRGGVGGHLDTMTVARAARRAGVKRLVFAHIGRPTLRALAAGGRPPFGEFATDGQVFLATAVTSASRGRRRAPGRRAP